MITKFGKDLSVLIVTEPGRDWEAYATWYSVFKNLPDARTAIVSIRNGETPFHLFQWTKRLKVPLVHIQPICEKPEAARWLDAARHAIQRKLVGENVLVIPHLVMALEVLDAKLLNEFANSDVAFGHNAIFLKNPNVDQLLNDILLDDKKPELRNICPEAKETQTLSSMVSYRKGCGKWIHRLKGCPFSNAAGLVTSDMTVNEIRIIDLWKRMCQLYSAVL